MIVEFNYLETSVGRMIAHLLRQDDVVAGVFAGTLQFLEKLKLLKALYLLKVQDENMKGEFKEILDRLKAANERRNLYTHSEYMPMLGPDDQLINMMHQKLKDHGKVVDLNQKVVTDLIKPLDKEDLIAFPNQLSILEQDVRVLAEKFVDSMPLG